MATYSGYNPNPYSSNYGYSTTQQVGNYTQTTSWNPNSGTTIAYSPKPGTEGNLGTPTSSSTGAGAGTGETQTVTEDPYTKYLKDEAARLERIRIMNAKAILDAQMAAFGLGALAGQISDWIAKGYEPEAVMALVRQSPEYASRFPAMKALQAKNRSITEAEYISYEQTMASYEKMFGLPTGMLTSKDMVTKLLTNEVSADEVASRATKAAASMYSLPQEFRDTMRRYYGVDSGGLTAYFLDPDVAAPLLERQYVSAQIGMEAWKQQVDVNASISEELYKQGVTREAARKGFGVVSSQTGFTGGAGETTDQKTLIDANLLDNAEAQKTVERIASSRTARFSGGGGFTGNSSGLTGLGASST